MSTRKKTVIVVEDEPDAAELFAEMMRVSGFRVLDEEKREYSP